MYNQNIWQSGDTITHDKLNNIEAGVAGVDNKTLTDLPDNSTHRLVTDDQIARWNANSVGNVKSINNILPDANGNVILPVNVDSSGFSANRPVNPLVGTRYFDTTLGKPIWYKGTGIWVDATGASLAAPATTPPAAVTALTVGTITSSSVVLNWTDSTTNNIANYEVAYSSDGGNTYTVANNTIASTATTYTVSNLIASTAYTFRVVAIDTTGNRSTAVTVTGTTSAGSGSTTSNSIVSDDFNRANNATSAGTTDSYNGGTNKTWNTIGSNSVGISSNQLYGVNNGSGAGYVDAGVSDARMQVTVATVGNEHDFYFRVDSSGHYYRYSYNTAGWFIQEFLTSFNTIASFTGPTLKAGDVVAVEAQGTASRLYVNNTLVRSDTLSDLLTNTGFGVGFSSTPVGYADNFNIIALAPASTGGGGTTTGGGGTTTGGTTQPKPTNYLSVADYGASGTSSSDVSSNIQNCINAAASQGKAVVIPAGTYWINPTKSLSIPSNMDVWFDQGAVIKALNANGASYQMIRIWYSSNVRLIGYPTLVGDKDSYAAGTSGEDGMGISMSGASTIYIENANVSKCMGDGIYLGNNGVNNAYNQNVTIVNSTFDSANRNNMSVISAINLTVNGCTFSNAKGNPAGPAAGVDFEPNTSAEFLQNINMDSCSFINNYGHGVWGDLYYINSSGHSVSINITNATVSGNSGQIYGTPGVQSQIATRSTVAGYVKVNGTAIYNK